VARVSIFRGGGAEGAADARADLIARRWRGGRGRILSCDGVQFIRHCEERSDEAIQKRQARNLPLLDCFAFGSQ